MLNTLEHDFSRDDWYKDFTEQYDESHRNYNPYLIQRGTFRPITDDLIIGVDSLISYDYMGAAEFEWGSLPASMRHICEHWSNFMIFKYSEIKNLDGEECYVLCHTGVVKEISEVIKKLFTERLPYRLHEWSGCYEYIHELPRNQFSTIINFWWDIEHHWMCCFGDNMRRLVLGMRKVCEKKELLWTNGPDVPASISPKQNTISIDASIRGLISVTTPNGKTTNIARKRVHSIKEYTSMIELEITNKAGHKKILQIDNLIDDTKLRILVQMIREDIKYQDLTD